MRGGVWSACFWRAHVFSPCPTLRCHALRQQILRALRANLVRHEHLRGHGPVGRPGRILLRSNHRGRQRAAVSARCVGDGHDGRRCKGGAHGRKCLFLVRSMVGLIPLYACLVLEESALEQLPNFRKRFEWYEWDCGAELARRRADEPFRRFSDAASSRPHTSFRFLKHKKELPDQVQVEETPDGSTSAVPACFCGRLHHAILRCSRQHPHARQASGTCSPFHRSSGSRAFLPTSLTRLSFCRATVRQLAANGPEGSCVWTFFSFFDICALFFFPGTRV